MSLIWIWLILFICLLVGSLGLFLIMEKIGALSTDDDLNTLSWYLKRARRKAKFWGYIVLFCVIFTPTIWLFLHIAEVPGFAAARPRPLSGGVPALQAAARPGFTGDSLTLANAAGVLVNNSLYVHCDDELQYAGMAEAPGHHVWIAGEYCDPWEVPGLYDDKLIGSAIITLAHEAHHTRGDLNEARTECWALQKTDDLARLLGYDEQHIGSIWYWARKDHIALIKAFPEYGNRKKCRPNGAWDLTPSDGHWP